MKNICNNCGKKLVGRTDKKFCNGSCKNKHHNSVRRSVVMESESRYRIKQSN